MIGGEFGRSFPGFPTLVTGFPASVHQKFTMRWLTLTL
jgi:hypothetical protein